MDDVKAAQRRRYRAAAAVTSIISLVGGVTFQVFSGDGPTQSAALKPRVVAPPAAPPSPAAPAPSTAPGMDFPGAMSGGMDSPTDAGGADYSAFTPGAAAQTVPLAASPPPAALQLPLQVPPFEAPALPPAEDLLGLVQPYVQAYIDSVTQSLGADLAESITGNALSTAANLAIGALDGLILYAAYVEDDNGRVLLNQLQNALPAIAAPPLAAEAAAPIPDFAGLSEAFAAVADMPLALGQVPPQLPRAEDVGAALAGLPQLPRAEDVGAALAALPPPQLPQLPQLPRAEDVAVGLAALPPPQLPQLPQLPRAEDVAGGIVAVTVAGLVLSAIFAPPKPPSLTRMLGLPF